MPPTPAAPCPTPPARARPPVRCRRNTTFSYNFPPRNHHLPNLPRRIVSCLSRLLILRSGAGNASVAREPPVSSKKLTWSERQAVAKKQQAGEDARSEAASVTTATAVDVNRVGSVAAAAAAGRQASKEEEKPGYSYPYPTLSQPMATSPPEELTEEEVGLRRFPLT
ncbi:hypothetical protein JB92DRAFT_2984271 [Gautieria morchelliformis]|nr:hypothetical protein JB92DRAFT_2984271 [Gautieria morchelliformis]